MAASNPFAEYLKQDPPELVGRDELLIQILRAVAGDKPQAFQLVGFRSLGTSAVLRYLAHSGHAYRKYARELGKLGVAPNRLIVRYLDCLQMTPEAELAGWMLTHLLAGAPPEAATWVEREGLAPTVALVEWLAAARQAHYRPVLLLDHLDEPLSKLKPEQAAALRKMWQYASGVTATEHPLVEINPHATASWFGAAPLKLALDPLPQAEARELLQRLLGQRQSFRAYAFLLELAGTHPYFLLQAAAEWYDLVRQFPTTSPDDLQEYLRLKLHETFDAYFVRFWWHLGAPDWESLGWLVARDEHPGAPAGPYWARLQRLANLGLVINYQAGFKPFSQLWREYIVKMVQAAQAGISAPSRVESAAGPGFLAPQERQVFTYLVANAEKVCPYGAIIENVWHESATSERRHQLSQVILKLRQALRDYPVLGGGQIVTYRRRGYAYRPG